MLLGLDKWLTAMWQIVNCKNGISSYEVHRAIGITQKSACLGTRHSEKPGEEVDENFIGGKARNMHIDAKKRRKA